MVFTSFQRYLAIMTLAAAVFFNALLCAVNSQLLSLAPAHVIGAELIIILLAALTVTFANTRNIDHWRLLIVVILLIVSLRFALTLSLDLKELRDLLLIPIFVCLGAVFGREQLARSLAIITFIVLAAALYEAAYVVDYSVIFNIKSYYINTRGLSEEDFYTEGSNLFVNAYGRGESRFFPIGNIHRVSSVFLEPVSLGNFATILTCYLSAVFGTIDWRQFTFLFIACISLLVLSDSRFATLAIGGVVLLSNCAVHLLPARLMVLIMPLCVILSIMAVKTLGLDSTGDDFVGRMVYNVDLLVSMSYQELLGLSKARLEQTLDSGVAYLILTQSVSGLSAALLAISIFSGCETLTARKYHAAVWSYLSLNMLVSYSFLSIKTAALLWFIHGALQRSAPRGVGLQDGSGRPQPAASASAGAGNDALDPSYQTTRP